MLLAHALMRLPMTSAAPAGSTLGAGDPFFGTEIAGILVGFGDPYNYGDAYFYGSLEPDEIDGNTITALTDNHDVGACYLYISGDRVSALSGKSLWIDDDEFPFSAMLVGPIYSGGSTICGMTPYGFAHGQSYTIDIR